MFARIEPVLGQRWYQESQNGNLAVSTSGPLGGLSAATGGWTGDTLSFVFPYEIYKYDCPPTGCTHMIAGSNRVWETVQGAVPASSWYANSPNLTKVTLADRSFINQLSYSVALSTTAIVGTNDGNVQYGFGLGQGTANTATWVNVTGGNSVLPNRPVLDVATDPVNPLVGYAALGGFDQNTPSTTGHVYQVTCTANCAGFTWVNKSGNLPNIPIDSIIANPLYPQQVFAGSDWGVYYTDNVNVASPVWIKFNAGMPNAMIWDMAIDRGFTTLAAFTRGRGAYAWPLPAGPVGGPTPTPTNTPTNTPIGNTPTNTPTNTNTPVGNTPTNTPTNTPVGSTPTNTPEGGSPTATATPCSITFTDVLPTDYFYVPVTYLYCHGAISGYADNTFRPGNLTTRGQLSKIVVLAEGWAIYTPPTPTFRDVDTSNAFYSYIETAYNHSIISGYDCGTGCLEFRPGNNVTRGQLTKIVVLAQNWEITPPSTSTFRDVPLGDAFYGYIETAYSHDIISGYDCGTGCLEFRPGNNATRGQISKIVYLAVIGP